MRGPGVASSFGRFGDDASGEVKEVLVDLPEGAHLLFQLAHLDRQVLLVSHQVLRRKTRQESCRHPASALAVEAAPPSSSKSRTISSPPFFASCSRAAPPPTPCADSRICPLPPIPSLAQHPKGQVCSKEDPQRDPHQQEALPPPPRSSHLFPRRAHLGVHPLALLQVALPGVLQGPDRMDSEDPLPTAPVLGTPPRSCHPLGTDMDKGRSSSGAPGRQDRGRQTCR